MVVAISEDPLTSSKKDNNNNNNNGTIPRRPKGRQVSSGYMSHSPSPSPSSTTTTTTSTSTSTTSSSSRRFPSLLLSHSTNSSTPLVPKCSQSVDRRHSRPSTPLPEVAKLLVTSTRSQSVYFQGVAFSLSISKTKSTATIPLPRKAATPERRRATLVKEENSRPADQHRWPARTKQVDHLFKSVDISNKKKVVGNGFGKVVRDLQKSMVVEGEKRRTSFNGLRGLSLDLRIVELLKGNSNANNNSITNVNNHKGPIILTPKV